MTRKNKLPPDTVGRFEALGIAWFPASPYPYLVACLDPQDEKQVGAMDQALADWRNDDRPCQQGRATDYEAADAYVAIVQIRRGPNWRGTIAHEVVHVKNYIADTVGITWDPNNDEAEAYLVGSLFHLIEENFSGMGYGKKS